MTDADCGNQGTIRTFGLKFTIRRPRPGDRSVFESLNAIRLKVDQLEAAVVEGKEDGRLSRTEDVPSQTLNVRRLLRADLAVVVPTVR